METITSVGLDEDHYRNEVLLLPTEHSETTRIQQLVDEAHELGLSVPEIEVTASVVASLAAGMIDLARASPVLSSGSSTDRNSICDVAPILDTPALDQVASSLSELTVSSNPAKCGSTRSTASLSTRPTSYSSSEGIMAHSLNSVFARPSSHRSSMLSLSSLDKKEKRRSSLKSAIGKIHFSRKRRSSSTVLLPPVAQISVVPGEEGVERIYVEAKPSGSLNPHAAEEDDEEVLKLELPFYDKEALDRSLENEELAQLRDSHASERDRHLAFQDVSLIRLRRKQQALVADRIAQNKAAEEQKREKNIADASRMEERQLAVEMDQLREFEKEKQNSRTRIKYMEGYFSTAHPPLTSDSESVSDIDRTPPARTYTPQQKAQLVQEYHDHEDMDRLHSAKIKVLRDRQERRLQEAVARMDRELDALVDKHALDFAALQRQHQHEETVALQALDAKKFELRRRWNLAEAILRNRLELLHGRPYGPLPPLSFSDPTYETRDSAICVSETTASVDGDEQTHPKHDGPVH